MKKGTRRAFIFGGLGALGLGGAGLWLGRNEILRFFIRQASNDLSLVTNAPGGDEVCVLTTQQVEGPFFLSSPMRSDIREDRKGKELNLRMQVLDESGCKPVGGAVVEVWHCDAEGEYSGYPAELAHDPFGTLLFAGTGQEHVEPVNEKRFLRGAQKTGEDGFVEFTTIVPGWYDPRVPHIHFKVFTEDKELITSQLYLDPEVTDKIFTTLEPYKRFGSSPYTLANDIVINQSGEAKGLVLKPDWSEDGPLSITARIGLARAAREA